LDNEVKELLWVIEKNYSNDIKIKTFNSKDVSVVFGPTVNLSDIAEKRVKRKSIQLVKNPKSIRN
jgi:hypothetical protein